MPILLFSQPSSPLVLPSQACEPNAVPDTPTLAISGFGPLSTILDSTCSAELRDLASWIVWESTSRKPLRIHKRMNDPRHRIRMPSPSLALGVLRERQCQPRCLPHRHLLRRGVRYLLHPRPHFSLRRRVVRDSLVRRHHGTVRHHHHLHQPRRFQAWDSACHQIPTAQQNYFHRHRIMPR